MSHSISAGQVKTIIFACEAGMGSSLMGVNSLKKKLKAAQITDVVVFHNLLGRYQRMRRWLWYTRGLQRLQPQKPQARL